MKKQERWLESLEAKTRQFEAAFIRQGFLLAEVEETEKTKNISAYFII